MKSGIYTRDNPDRQWRLIDAAEVSGDFSGELLLDGSAKLDALTSVGGDLRFYGSAKGSVLIWTLALSIVVVFASSLLIEPLFHRIRCVGGGAVAKTESGFMIHPENIAVFYPSINLEKHLPSFAQVECMVAHVHAMLSGNTRTNECVDRKRLPFKFWFAIQGIEYSDVRGNFRDKSRRLPGILNLPINSWSLDEVIKRPLASIVLVDTHADPRTRAIVTCLNSLLCSLSGSARLSRLPSDDQQGQKERPYSCSLGPYERVDPIWVMLGFWCLLSALACIIWGDRGLWTTRLSIFLLFCLTVFCIAGHVENCSDGDKEQYQRPVFRSQSFQYNSKIVLQKLLTGHNYWSTVIKSRLGMANVLNIDKQIAVIAALAEGSSIRSIERMTGIHRDTIMRLGVRIGQGCMAMMDREMRNLPCERLELDEIWGYIGKKEVRVMPSDDPTFGDVWTWTAIDAETKLVPAFKVGKRDSKTALAFLSDLNKRMRNRVQISTDGFHAYVSAMEKTFAGNADYGQVVKVYAAEELSNHRYRPPEVTSVEKTIVSGRPNVALISTSYVERLNAATRLHMRRLTRLTHAFSKKRENFEAAVGLHFAYYNYVRRHNTLRCTPAMAAGVAKTFWSVGDLVEAAA